MSSFEDPGSEALRTTSRRAAVEADPVPVLETRFRGLGKGRALLAAVAGAVAVLAVLGLAGLVAPRWDRAVPVTSGQPGPPAVVVAAARELLRAVEPGYSVTGPAEWVRTTRRAYERLAGYREPDADEELYVVQVRGQFTCPACSRPYGARVQTGSAVSSGFPVHRQGETTGSIGPPLDLSQLGTVNTFPVS